ncbi:MAG: 7-carboxy-7-deazaguanine synthase, partial [Bradyrhizobiaceae bacterium]|nr:7-carboxy-7-deazaguanine synthase [Bradyrhizobiaceae bacterium]
VFPQEALRPENLGDVEFQHLWLQPMDGPNRSLNTEQVVQFCLQNPRWRMSLQTHKFIGIR